MYIPAWVHGVPGVAGGGTASGRGGGGNLGMFISAVPCSFFAPVAEFHTPSRANPINAFANPIIFVLPLRNSAVAPLLPPLRHTATFYTLSAQFPTFWNHGPCNQFFRPRELECAKPGVLEHDGDTTRRAVNISSPRLQ